MPRFNPIIPVACGVIVFAFCLCLGILAWNNPTVAPPGNNAAAPINIGSNAQDKSGPLSATKLNVNDGTGACCAGYYTLSVNEGGANQPTLQFHDAGVAEGQMILKGDIGGGQRGFLFQSVQTTMGGKFTGNIESSTQLKAPNVCVGNDCRAAWPALNIPAATCPDGHFVSGINSTGGLICSPIGGIYWTPNPCATQLPSGGKRIFVTSTTYIGSSFADSEAKADQNCQQAADGTGYTGTYKALVWLGNREPSSVLPSGNTFWNGAKSGQDGKSCAWNLVALNTADFFQADGSGNYLENPIQFNEQGYKVSNLEVWTGFQPTNGGNYIKPDVLLANYSYDCFCLQGKLISASFCTNTDTTYNYTSHAITFIGLAENIKQSWAGTAIHKSQLGWNTSCGLALSLVNEIKSSSRALYCVEQ